MFTLILTQKLHITTMLTCKKSGKISTKTEQHLPPESEKRAAQNGYKIEFVNENL